MYELAVVALAVTSDIRSCDQDHLHQPPCPRYTVPPLARG